MADVQNILLPPGRIIQGDVYVGSDKDSKGNDRVVKTGPNAGQKVKQFFIATAIPKGGEQHWAYTDWGKQIWAIGAAGHPNFYQNRGFAWKIEDGDSAEVNKNGKRMCDAEGAKGHWIVKCSTQIAPTVHQQSSPGVFERLDTPGLLKRGWWAQVSISVKPNTGETPGVYINHSMLLFFKTDAEISSGPDAATAFAGAVVATMPGVTALPFAGAPMAGMPAPMPHPTMGSPMQPAMAGMQPGPATQPAAMPAGPAMPGATPAGPAPTMVQPHPGFLAGPGAMPGPGMQPAAPGAPAMPMAPGLPPGPTAAPQVPAGPQMTAAGIASGFTLAQYQQQGWTEAQLRQNGIIY